MSISAINYAHLTFEQLLEEEKKLTLKVDEEFKKKNHLNSCIKKMSPAMLQAIRTTFKELSDVLKQLEKRSKELNKDCFNIPLSKKLWCVRFLTHVCFVASSSLEVVSLTIDCLNAIPYEIAATASATGAVALSLLNQYGENSYASIREMQARLQHCSIEDLRGIEALNSFLNKFSLLVELVKPSDTVALKISQESLSDPNQSIPARSFFSFEWLRRGTRHVSNVINTEIPSRRKLARKCIDKLDKVPDSLLEKYTGHKALYTRSEWISVINDFASYQEDPYSSDEGSDNDISFVSQDSADNQHCKDVSVKIEKLDKYSHLSLAKLIEQFNILIRQLDEKFDPMDYLSRRPESSEFPQTIINVETNESENPKNNVRALIVRMKEVHDLITKRREEYNKGLCCGLISAKRKLTALHFCKYIASFTNLAAVALTSASSCQYDYQIKDTIKAVAIVAGVAANVFEEISFWAGRKETKIKTEVAHLLNAEIIDLSAIDQFTYFIDQFFDYISDLPNVSDLGFSDTEKTNEEEMEHDDNDIVLSNIPAQIGATVKNLQQKAKRLSGYESLQQTWERKLTRCLEALKAVDNTYLEKIFNRKSAADTKHMWKTALIDVYDKATGQNYIHRNLHTALSVEKNILNAGKNTARNKKSEENENTALPDPEDKNEIVEEKELPSLPNENDSDVKNEEIC